MKNPLLSPFKLSDSVSIKNRVVMAPMTRRFADKQSCPTRDMADYYAKRSDAGLIITEGTLISEDAIGYGNIPGIYTQEQITAWRKVTEQVHKNNGKIFLQLWHCGRVSHPNFHNGNLPISASSTQMTTPLGNSGFQTGLSREASVEEIQSLIKDFAQAAGNAIKSGFDGVEIHGANGYLIDQFNHHCTNLRDDDYGGTPEKMARFCLEVVKACGEKIGFDRVGIRLSPAGHMGEIITHQDDKLVFKYLLIQLEQLPICYVHTGNFDDSIVFEELDNMTMTDFLRRHYAKNVIAAGGYNLQTGMEFVKQHSNNLIAYGRPFIANPELIQLIESDSKWQEYDSKMLRKLI